MNDLGSCAAQVHAVLPSTTDNMDHHGSKHAEAKNASEVTKQEAKPVGSLVLSRCLEQFRMRISVVCMLAHMCLHSRLEKVRKVHEVLRLRGQLVRCLRMKADWQTCLRTAKRR